MNTIFGYQVKQTIIHQLSGTTKFIAFLLLTTLGMLSFDPRFLLLLVMLSLVLLHLSQIKFHEYRMLFYFIVIFAMINLLLIYLLAPDYGVKLYHHKTPLIGSGYFMLTAEQLLYESTVLLKYLLTFPLSIIFLFSTHPSQFAASLNKIGLPYKITYAVAITLRYIPDLQSDYVHIKQTKQARGLDLSPKAPLIKRVQANIQIVLPLIFTSLNRIDTISQAMELRRFGLKKTRTWYAYQPMQKNDLLTLLGLLFIVLIASSFWFINQGRYWNPFIM